jgi:hypothetical protein
VDAVASTVHDRKEPFDGENLLAQARVMVGFQLFSRLAVFAGPTYNTYFAFSPEERRKVTTMKVTERPLGSDGAWQRWPGFQAGLRL